MKIKLSKYCYIKCSKDYGYLYNEQNHKSRTYDGVGADFLRFITYEFQDIIVILNRLSKIYEVDKGILETDFKSFINELANDSFFDITNCDKDSYSVSTSEHFSYIKEEYKLEELTVELTSSCNEKCIHCYIPSEIRREKTKLPIEKVLSIIDDFLSMGGKRIAFTGGEAFLYNDLMDIVDYCIKKRLEVSIMSNLTCLKEKQLLKLKGLTSISFQVSLYSIRPEIHDDITQVSGSCEKTMDSINKLVNMGIKVTISCPIMKANYLYFTEILSYAKKNNINVITDCILLARSDMSTENLSNRLSIEELKMLLNSIVKADPEYAHSMLRRNRDIMGKDFCLAEYINSPLCNVARNMLYINSKGVVTLCPAWANKKVANIYSSSLKDIWSNETLSKIRSIREKAFPLCVKCEASDYCSRCLCRNYNESQGDMYKISKQFCEVAFLNKEIYEENFDY